MRESADDYVCTHKTSFSYGLQTPLAAARLAPSLAEALVFISINTCIAYCSDMDNKIPINSFG